MMFLPLSAYLPLFVLLFLVGRDALADGKAGMIGRTHAIVRHLGTRPTFDPVHNQHHEQLARDLIPDVQLPVWQLRLEAIEQKLTLLVRLPWLLLATLALLGVEFLSDVQLLKAINGLSDLRRNLIGVGMAVALFVLAEVLARLSAKRTWLFWTAMLIAMLIVFSITVVTLDSVTDDGTTIADLGLAIILALTVVGPAALNVLVIEQLRVLLPLRRERALKRQYIRQAATKQRRAEQYITRLAAWTAWWDRRVARLEAQYNYKLQRAARKHGTKPDVIQSLLASEESLVPQPQQPTRPDPPPADPAPRQRAPVPVAVRVPSPYRQHGGNGKDES